MILQANYACKNSTCLSYSETTKPGIFLDEKKDIKKQK